MLDAGMLEQLKGVFARLENPVTLEVSTSSHADQSTLDTLVDQLASITEKVRVTRVTDASTEPRLKIRSQRGRGSIVFRGVPGGHEFTSLVLAILNTDGKGKLPDSGIQHRIQALRGPIHVKTFMSLTCENCPDVVQALNLMASLHADFEHEVIDGGVAPEEVKSLGLQGVPAVVIQGKLVHSGKSTLSELLEKLEGAFGTSYDASVSRDLGLYDVAIIGGGPAGASAAIYSARKGLKTVILAERFGGQLRETLGIENMISMPYTEGSKLTAQLSEHIGAYKIEVLEHRKVKQLVPGAVKRLDLESGETLSAKSVIVATGAHWRMLNIPGEKEHIGQGVAFCAHCDGPFYKGKRVAVVGGGNSGVEAAIDLAGIAESVVLLEYGEKLRADEVLVNKLKSLPNTSILTQAQSTEVIGENGKVVALEYKSRATDQVTRLEIDGVFVQIGLVPNSQFVKDLVDVTASGEIVVDSKGRTSMSGVYAAGDVTTIPFKQIVMAMGDGAKAALTAFEDRMREGA